MPLADAVNVGLSQTSLGSALLGENDGLDKATRLLGGRPGLVDFPDVALSALSLVVDADLFTYNEVNLVTGEARFVLRPRRDAGGRVPSSGFFRRFGYHPAATSAADPERVRPNTLPRFVTDPRLRSVGVGNCCGEAEINLNAGLELAQEANRLIGVTVSCAVRPITETEYEDLKIIQHHLSDALRGALENATGSAAANDRPKLTRRENEVLYWVSMGKTNEEIAVIIGASPLTVKKHLEHIYEKLEVPNRTAAATLAGRNPDAFRLVIPPADSSAGAPSIAELGGRPVLPLKRRRV